MTHFIQSEDESYVYGYIPDKDDSRKAYLGSLYVPEEHRGHGIGSRLLMAFVGACIATGGIHEIWSEFKPFRDSDPDQMRAFYEHHGFEFYYNENNELCVRKTLSADYITLL